MNYRRQWQKYRLFTILWPLSFASFIPTSVYVLPWLASRGLIPSRNPVSSRPAYWILMIPGATFVYFFDRMLNFLCPRCGRPFFKKSWYSTKAFARECVHCGLPKFDPGDSK